MGIQITVRDVDEKAFKEFKAFAVSCDMKLGSALNLAMEKFKSEFARKGKFTDLKPIDWGPGTETASDDVDKILYGG